MNGLAENGPDAPGHTSRGADPLVGFLSLLVDELSHGVLVVSPGGRLLHANQAARRVLRQQKSLTIQHAHLVAAHPGQGRELLDAVARGAAGRRSLVRLHAPGTPTLSIAVLPLRAAQAPQPGAVALVLSRATVCDSLMLCFYARTYGLTNMEEQVLAILCQGYSAPEAARQLHVAVSTIRSHVRSMCAKTQTNGVRALVGQVAVLPPLGHSLQQHAH